MIYGQGFPQGMEYMPQGKFQLLFHTLCYFSLFGLVNMLAGMRVSGREN